MELHPQDMAAFDAFAAAALLHGVVPSRRSVLADKIQQLCSAPR